MKSKRNRGLVLDRADRKRSTRGGQVGGFGAPRADGRSQQGKGSFPGRLDAGRGKKRAYQNRGRQVPGYTGGGAGERSLFPEYNKGRKGGSLGRA